VRAERRRLDLALVALGLAPSREQAQALVMAGDVTVDGQPARKPGQSVGPEARLLVRAHASRVGRGAGKLLGALEAFGVSPAGRVALDVGASTGGFTEVLLERGARRVYAVDVGRAQLHERLRADPRVIVLEKTNARRLSLALVPEPCSLLVMDVSFISAHKLLPGLLPLLADGADALVLVKPQFEVGRRQVGRGGLVKDPLLQQQAIARVALSSRQSGYAVLDARASAVRGATGNREFFLWLRKGDGGLPPDEIERLAAAAVAA
jgi:23S rRNA (cytidine1920-2'-O)/16S rRNA (cytidine1409-2'-O)-methyltransferase